MIETERLIIREVQTSDVNDIFEYAKDEDTGPRAGWPPHKNIEETKNIVNVWKDSNHTEKVFVIVFKEHNKVIGTIGVTNLNKHLKDEKNHFAKEFISQGKAVYEIGTTISKQYWGKGVSTESLNNVLNYVFEELGADIVLTLHYKANIASARVQEKNNMRVIGQYDREKKWYNTDCVTMIVRAKTKEDWALEKI